jgi:protease secretion system membrane fusion protein
LREESGSVAQLAKEGFVAKNQANQAFRSKLDAELTMNSFQANYFKEIDTQLAQIQSTRDAMKDRVQSVSFDRDLASIRAPVTGTVVGLKANTVGGIVRMADVLAEIVPIEAKLIVEAQVPPNVIDKVRVGLLTHMRFTAFNVDTTPVVDGRVTLVGADKQPGANGAQGADFYLAQVEATDKAMQELGNLKIQPGMPVDVIIVTGERTFMSYLFKPIRDKLAKAFK